jgi:hypothetical protein
MMALVKGIAMLLAKIFLALCCLFAGGAADLDMENITERSRKASVIIVIVIVMFFLICVAVAVFSSRI